MVSLPTDITIAEARDKITLKYRGKTLASIKKETLAELLKGMLDVDPILSDIDKRAFRLAADYIKLRKKFYRGKVTTITYTKQHKDFKHFLSAIKIIDRVETTSVKFLKAQVDGLKFVNDNMGTFPKPSQLSSIGAEERVIRYLEEAGEIQHNADMSCDLTKVTGQITISKYDRETPLRTNKKYMTLLSLLRENKASMEQAQYLKLCRKVRKGSVGPEISEYIIKLRE